ncbi:MAG: DUF3137 domain-containing protein [Planctomycetota bacterium]
MESPVLIVVVLGVLVVAGLYLGARQARKRREALAALAARLGLRFSRDDPYHLASRLGTLFPTLTHGDNRYAYNVAAGSHDGRPVFLFDFHHETTSTDSKGRRQTHHHHRSFVSVDHDVDLGRMEVRPEHFFDKMKAFFGFDDIDFESAEFSKKYYVKGEDRELAYKILHPQMIEYLLALDGLKVTANGPHALFRYGSGRMSADEIETALTDGFGFLDLIPRYLRKDRAAGSSP